MGGDFTSLVGNSTSYLKLWYIVESNITQGTTYRFRVRAFNAVGWSTFSNVGYILAAQVPMMPPTPAFVSSDSQSITMTF